MRHPHAADKLAATIPDEWPQKDLRELLPHFIQLLQHDPGSYPWFMWIIVSKEHQSVIGDVGFKGRPDKNGAIEIGYSLLHSYRRNGYMKEAAEALVKWAFRKPVVKRLIAECHKTNISSQRILEHLGMQPTNLVGEMQYWLLLNQQDSDGQT